MNRISMQNRLLIGIISTLVMLFVFIFPSELTDVWESAGFQGVVIAIIISIAAIQIAAISSVFKPISWIEALPLLLAVILIWTSLFVVDGTFEVAPGNYRNIQPSFLVISVPMFMLVISGILAGITLVAPAQDRRNTLKAQEAVLRWKNRFLGSFSRRAVLAGVVGALGIFVALDSFVRISLVSSVNSCIEKDFQQGWRSAYLSEAWRVPFTWSETYIAGYEQWGEWWVTPAEKYVGPTDWTEFVAEVSTKGIPVTIVKNGNRTNGYLYPKRIEDADLIWEGFDFDQYVLEIKTACTDNISPPLFPIASDWKYGKGGVKNSISDIDGYVAPVESATP